MCQWIAISSVHFSFSQEKKLHEFTEKFTHASEKLTQQKEAPYSLSLAKAYNLGLSSRICVSSVAIRGVFVQSKGACSCCRALGSPSGAIGSDGSP